MKSKNIVIRVTPEEKKKISDKASKEEKSVSRFIIDQCIEKAPVFDDESATEILEIQNKLHKLMSIMSNNLNQIAKAINSSELTHNEIVEVLKVNKEHFRTLRLSFDQADMQLTAIRFK